MNDNTSNDIQSVQGMTPDFKTEFAKQLSELAPELVADGKIDSKKLKELLDGDEADDSERFGLFWPGKKRAMRAAQEPTTATLKPAKDESKDWDTTQNLFIEGDNLEVLKVLQKHYHNKITMIYIDPPYNTGKDFVYPDNYKEGLASYLEFTNQVDTEGRKVSTNSDTDGRYHSNWLNMVYPRLKLARNLLTDDGVIFISIDDSEVENLKKVTSEIFGEANFIAQVIWKRKRGKDNSAKYLSRNHEYILIYARNTDKATFFRLELDDLTRKAYRNPDNDPRGDYRLLGAWARGTQGGSRFAFKSKSGLEFSERLWLMNRDSMTRLDSEDKLVFVGDKVYRKLFLTENNGSIPETIWDDTYNAENAADEIKNLFGYQVFDTVKPIPYIERMLKLQTSSNDIILDFFSGSGTTAHAVMSLNAKDGSQRKHIQVQLPEPTDVDSPAYKEGLRTISDIAKERIRRAGEKIKADYADKLTERDLPLDTGFRVYKLADSNFTKWSSDSATDKDSLQQHLLGLRESSNDAASEEDLLTEVLLKQGISLTAPINHSDVDGLSVWTVGDNLVCAYLNERQKPSLDQLRSVAANEPAKLIVLEDAFQGDDELKTNLVQICKSQKIELWTVQNVSKTEVYNRCKNV